MIFIYILLCVIVLLLVAVAAFIVWGVNFSCKGGKPSPYEGTGEYADIVKAGIEWIKAQKKDDIFIKSHDGLKLHASLIENDKTNILLLLMHGYRSSAFGDFSGAVKMYYEAGYSILLPDQRAHGESEGKYITYGIKESYDCKSWCEWIKEKHPEKVILLDGISMGASTVLMASGLSLPSNVAGIIADCGFTSPYEIIEKVAEDMGYPTKIVMPFLNLGIKLIAGFDPKGTSTCKAMENNSLPILFVHGKADDFVPCEMSERCFNACKSEKRLVIVEEAGHGLSFMVDHDRVVKELFSFIEDSLEAYEKRENK